MIHYMVLIFVDRINRVKIMNFFKNKKFIFYGVKRFFI